MRKSFLFWGSVVLIIMGNVLGCVQVPVEKGRQCESHYLMGVSYLKEGNPTMAMKEFLVAESLDSSRADVQDGLGQSYRRKKSYDLAEKHYLRALELEPKEAKYANNLGDLYLAMGAYDKAISFFQQAADSLHFNTPEIALTGIGVAWFHKGDQEQALKSYRLALEANRSYAPANYYAGEIFRERKDYSRAREYYQRALELWPNYVPAHYSLGLMALEESLFDEARSAFQKVIELAPESEIGDKARQQLKNIRYEGSGFSKEKG